MEEFVGRGDYTHRECGSQFALHPHVDAAGAGRMVIAGDQQEAVNAAAPEFQQDEMSFLVRRQPIVAERDEPRGGVALALDEGESQVVLVQSVESGRAAHQHCRDVSGPHQLSALLDAPPVVIASQHYRDVGFGRAIIMHQRISQEGQPQVPKEDHDYQKYRRRNEKFEEREAPSHHGLLLVRGVLLVEVADRLQPLVKALDFRLILRQQDAVARRGSRLAAGRQDFAPKLAVGDAIDEGVA